MPDANILGPVTGVVATVTGVVATVTGVVATVTSVAATVTGIDEDRFEVLRQLGAGGMGVVYEAVDRARGTRVAVKTLHKLTDPDAIERFKREFRTIQDVAHPNLIALFELLQTERSLCFTMELVAGTDFLVWARRRPGTEAPLSEAPLHALQTGALDNTELTDDVAAIAPVTPRAARPITSVDEVRLRLMLPQLVAGLHALHRAGKVHRDLKPTNVMITPEGRVVVLDFGVVADLAPDPGKQDAFVAGTLVYMAPEQLHTADVSPAADWYALGVMIFEALTGQVPHDEERAGFTTRKLNEVAARASTIVASVPPDLDELCAALLARDPAARPGAEEILTRLGESAGATLLELGPAATDRPLFVGRGRELAAFDDELTKVGRGQPHALVMFGPSGVGKSTALRKWIEVQSSRARPATVLWGRCYERESASYKAFDGVVDAAARLLRRLPQAEARALLPQDCLVLPEVFPSIARQLRQPGRRSGASGVVMEPAARRARLFAELRELLVNLAQRGPLVVAIDDVQWADGDSLAMLRAVLRPPHAPALLLLCTYRSDSSSSPEAFARVLPCAAQALAVSALGLDDSRRLVRELAERHGHKGQLDVDAIAREAAGHPFFLDALVRHIVSGAELGVGGIHLEDALLARTRRLAPELQRLLTLLALTRRPLRQAIAASAADLEPAQFARGVAQLRAAGLARTLGVGARDTIELYHDKVGVALLGCLALNDRRTLHGVLAAAYERLMTNEPETIAIHLRAAGEEVRAVRYAIIAADQAYAAYEFERAVTLYRFALGFAVDPAARHLLQTQLGTALSMAGRGSESAEVLLAAARAANPGDALELRRRAANELLHGRRLPEGFRLLREVLAPTGHVVPKTHTGTLLRVIWARLRLRLRGYGFRECAADTLPTETLELIDSFSATSHYAAMVDSVMGAYFQAEHVRLALDAGEPFRVVRAVAWQAVYVAAGGAQHAAAARRMLADLEPFAASAKGPIVGEGEGLLWIEGGSAMVAFLVGDWKRCVEHVGRVEALFQKHGLPATFDELEGAQHFANIALLFLGRLTEARKRIGALLAQAEDRADAARASDQRAGSTMLIWLAADQPEEGRRQLMLAVREGVYEGFQQQHLRQLYARVALDLYLGHADAALDAVRQVWRPMMRSVVVRAEYARVNALDLAARAALGAAAGDRKARAKLLTEAARHAARLRRIPARWAVALGQLAGALVELGRGHDERAQTDLAAAAIALDGVDMPLHAAAARWQLGELIGGIEGERLRADARGLLEEAGVVRPERFVEVLAPSPGLPPVAPRKRAAS